MGRLSKLCLVLADHDGDYIGSLENYIRKHHGSGFEVCSFTDTGCLASFLSAADNRADILLAGPEFLDAGVCGRAAAKVLVLNDGKTKASPKGIDPIKKYQHAEKLVTEVLRRFSADSDVRVMPAGKNATIVTCFISPGGGSGKSVISAGCSMVCAKRGMKALYLNIEDIPSTGLFFEGESEQNLSNVIYYLKCRDKNLDMRLAGARCTDVGNGVHFYLPPESPTEASCLKPRELEELIGSLRRTAAYDVVFIDLPGGLDERTVAVMNACGRIVCVCGCDAASSHKLALLQKELEFLEKRLVPDLQDKLVYVSNESRSPEAGYSALHRVKQAAVAFGFCESPYKDAGFNSGIDRLLGILSRGWSA